MQYEVICNRKTTSAVTYSEPCQTSKKKDFAKTVIFEKFSILNV